MSSGHKDFVDAAFEYLLNRQVPLPIAEELAQEVGATAPLPVINGGPQMWRRWLSRVVRHRAIDYYRRCRSQRGSVPHLEAEARGRQEAIPNPSDVAAAEEQRKRVWLAMQRLDQVDRQVLYLRYWFGFDFNEMAEVLRIKEDAARKRLVRARGRIRQFLE